MTDPLLTIDEATREFRVSPKTIRRRLTAGEIAGAYKRPGNRGPEWVMPREALAAAGFSPRRQDAPAALPASPEDRAAYWEQRAADAEAALHTPTSGEAPAARGPGPAVRWRWLLVGCALLLGLIAGVVTFAPGGGDEAPAAPDAMATVATFLEAETQPGDAIGLVGQQRRDAVPAGRRVAATPTGGWDAAGGPRYVVATYDDSSTPVGVAELRSDAALLLRVPLDGVLVDVYDRQAPPEEGVSVTAATTPTPDGSDTLDVSSTERPSPGVGGGAEPAEPTDASGSGTVDDDQAVPPASAPAAEDPPAVEEAGQQGASPASGIGSGEVVIQQGESFWSIAERTVASARGSAATQASVASYWSALVAANVDRLVEPGNPDLLHVAQTIVLPPVT